MLYPKYLHAFIDAPVWDSVRRTWRFIDFLLVDSYGHVDIVEIKKPFDNCIVSQTTYRDNHIPMRELTGTTMQMEKYIYHLGRSGRKNERKLSERYAAELPDGLHLKTVNPKGIIIMGRDSTLSGAQREDFEIIKRKYRNVIDILSYDDLLARLKFTIAQLQYASEDQRADG